jgi:hypothetical protein
VAITSWTYDPDLPTNMDKVRAIINDVDDEDKKISNDQINLHLDLNNQNLYRSAAAVARTLALQFGAQEFVTLGPLSVSGRDAQGAYEALAESLDQQAKDGTGITFAPGIHSKFLHNDDDDMKSRIFRIGMHDDPNHEAFNKTGY